ncbi:MAG: hypothetical protein KGL44_10315 [Sphingomonadales bacterium]|nr:hypothetical protein [Sphingomonadales bacterium]
MLHFETIPLWGIALFIALGFGVFAAFRWFDRRHDRRIERSEARRRERVAQLRKDWDEKIGGKGPDGQA